MMIPGRPGSVAPTAFTAPPDTCARYHTDGTPAPRWGSLASTGLPVAVREPCRTQLLLAAIPLPTAGAARSSEVNVASLTRGRALGNRAVTTGLGEPAGRPSGTMIGPP